MKNSRFLLLGALGATLLTATAARADVSWQHTGRVTANGGTGTEKLFTFDFNNSWSGANHRTVLKYDASPMAQMGSMMGAPMDTEKMARGEFSIIERLDDDKFVVAVPAANTLIEEPYSTLKERFRFNLWEGLDTSLGNGDVPELTAEQRERLGHEVRAVLSPFTRRLTRTYFRALPNRRTIKGLECRGYRYTTIVNISGKPGGTQWARFAAEWWLADVLPGDQEIIDFTQRANKIKTDGGPPTQSMWLNEYYPVLWQVAPPELHRALESLVGYQGAENYGFQGTPAQFFVTFGLPKTDYSSGKEDVRFALELKNRSQDAVEPTVFATPTGLKRQPIEPFLKMVQNGIRKTNQSINEALDKELGPIQKTR